MATRQSLPEEDLSCPVCYNIFKDPVLLHCSHSFCRACLKTYWTERRARECPVCRKRSSLREPQRNLALRNLCEAYSQGQNQRAFTGTEVLCSLHGETLENFCLNDHQPVWLVCQDSKSHTEHRFRPINKAAVELKGLAWSNHKALLCKRGDFEGFLVTCNEIAEHIKVQAEHSEKKIRQEFRKLNQFLHEEERAMVAALREEEQQKSCAMEENIQYLRREILNLSDKIRTTEEAMRVHEDMTSPKHKISFLQEYKAIIKEMELPLYDPPEVTGALIDVPKHIGNLTFRVWENMKEKFASYTPVILDHNTADCSLLLSEDLTSVSFIGYEDKQMLPHNPERFECPGVMGSEGFESGTHSWDVEVGDSEYWEVGVAAADIDRYDQLTGGRWMIQLDQGEYKVLSRPDESLDTLSFLETELGTPLGITRKPQRIRVHLDYDGGSVLLTDVETQEVLHHFDDTFTEKVFPYIGNSCPLHSVKVMPAGPL